MDTPATIFGAISLKLSAKHCDPLTHSDNATPAARAASQIVYARIVICDGYG